MEHLTKKYGPRAAKQFDDPNNTLMSMGRAVGIHFNNKRKIYDTKKAHALMEFVKTKHGNEKANEFMVELYKKYFELGEDISDAQNLITLVSPFGVDEAEAKSAISSGESDIVEKDRMYKNLWGISGVPFYIIKQNSGDEDIQFSGAYPVEFISKQLKEASTE